MHNIPLPNEKIKHTGNYVYTDKIRVWFMQSVSLERLEWWAKGCGCHKGGKLTIEKFRKIVTFNDPAGRTFKYSFDVINFVDSLLKTVLHAHYKRAMFDPRYEQQVQFYQPSDEVIMDVAKVNDHYFNYLEESLDLTFDYTVDKEEAYQFISGHVVKNNHGNQTIAFKGEKATTRYSGPRTAPNVLVVYNDKHSKVTGEAHCLHFDYKMTGRRSLERNGIHSLRDVVNLDRKRFWELRLLLRKVDVKTLGRKYLNMLRRQRRKDFNEGKIRLDVLTGGMLFHANNGSVQETIDCIHRICRRLKTHLAASHYVQKIDNGTLLPK
jgi:hypothetical protein